MTGIDVKKTKQLAIDACIDIKAEIKRNQLRDIKKQTQTAPFSSSSSCPSKSKKSKSDSASPRKIIRVNTPGSTGNSTAKLQYRNQYISDELFEDSDQDGPEEQNNSTQLKINEEDSDNNWNIDDDDDDDDDDFNGLFENYEENDVLNDLFENSDDSWHEEKTNDNVKDNKQLTTNLRALSQFQSFKIRRSINYMFLKLKNF